MPPGNAREGSLCYEGVMALTKDSFQDFNKKLIADLRANKGKPTSGPFVGRPVLILSTTGAKSGAARSTPLVYGRDGERYIIIASMGGAPTNPSWFHNLVANPIVTVEVEGEAFKARATVAPEPERRRLYDKQAAKNPGFAEYEKKTTRTIPVVTLERVAA